MAFGLLGDYWPELRHLSIICPHLSYLWNAGGCCFFLYSVYQCRVLPNCLLLSRSSKMKAPCEIYAKNVHCDPAGRTTVV